jgi:hypothetical protein
LDGSVIRGLGQGAHGVEVVRPGAVVVGIYRLKAAEVYIFRAVDIYVKKSGVVFG